VTNTAKRYLATKPVMAAERPTGSAADPTEPSDSEKMEQSRHAMTEKLGETFLLCMKHLEAKDVGVTRQPSNMDPGVH
jgi:hypothetical protein